MNLVQPLLVILMLCTLQQEGRAQRNDSSPTAAQSDNGTVRLEPYVTKPRGDARPRLLADAFRVTSRRELLDLAVPEATRWP